MSMSNPQVLIKDMQRPKDPFDRTPLDWWRDKPSGLHRLAGLVNVLNVVVAIGGVIWGLVVAFKREADPYGYGDTGHPHVFQGIGIIVGSLVFAMLVALAVFTAAAIGDIRTNTRRTRRH